VMDADSQKVITIPVQGWPGWLPDGRLAVSYLSNEGPQDKSMAHVVNVETGEDVAITGTYHTWSSDGRQVAYWSSSTIWIADANGRNARQVAEGGWAVWSPDSKQLAFWGVRFEPVGKYNTRTSMTEIQVVDLASGTVRTLARKDDWLPPADNSSQESEMGSLAWSPDGSLLAVGIQRQKEAWLFVLSADTGAVRARQSGILFPFPLPFIRSWSPDSRYVIFGVMSDSSAEIESFQLGILDVSTSQSVMLPSIGHWDWSPDGKWLAAAQMYGEGGVWLVTPDLTSMRQLAVGMSCINVAWKP